MFFILEKDNQELATEYFLWKHLLNDTKQHKYIECSHEELPSICASAPQDAIPLGSIPFTNFFFKLRHNISQINPIEIPKCLRKDFFLGREYDIVAAEKVPSTGSYFIKDASVLKQMHYYGPMENFDRGKIDKNHQYVVSELVDIIAEYRVYIIRGEIYAIEYYNGDPTVFPDVQKIKTANMIYQQEKDYPRSYTIDVMVTPKGTFITEIHPVLFAVGLYTTVLSDSFLHGYQDGLHYILRYNTPVYTK